MLYQKMAVRSCKVEDMAEDMETNLGQSNCMWVKVLGANCPQKRRSKDEADGDAHVGLGGAADRGEVDQ